MLDTNIVSDLMKHPTGKAAARLAVEGESGVCLSIISMAELRYGAAKKGSPRLMARVEDILAVFDVLPLNAPADTQYGILRARLEVAGQMIGPNDLFIAAHALALNVTLATANISEFSRVKDLRIENWLA